MRGGSFSANISLFKGWTTAVLQRWYSMSQLWGSLSQGALLANVVKTTLHAIAPFFKSGRARQYCRFPDSNDISDWVFSSRTSGPNKREPANWWQQQTPLPSRYARRLYAPQGDLWREAPASGKAAGAIFTGCLNPTFLNFRANVRCWHRSSETHHRMFPCNSLVRKRGYG